MRIDEARSEVLTAFVARAGTDGWSDRCLRAAAAEVGADLAAFTTWLGAHGNALLMVLFVIALFHHAQLGVHEVIEDYVHGEKAKVASLVAVKFVAALFGASCVLATLRVSFGG